MALKLGHSVGSPLNLGRSNRRRLCVTVQTSAGSGEAVVVGVEDSSRFSQDSFSYLDRCALQAEFSHSSGQAGTVCQLPDSESHFVQFVTSTNVLSLLQCDDVLVGR